MTESEAVVYWLKLDRESIVRRASEYHRARIYMQSAIEPGAVLNQALAPRS